MSGRLDRPVEGLVLAAGAGRRFGAVKQLAPLAGRPLLEHALRAMTSSPQLDGVVVTLGAHAEQIAAAIDLNGARIAPVADWEEGIAASLRAGIAALRPDTEAVVIALGDQPGVTATMVARVVEAARASGCAAARATHGGQPGHPVLLRRELFAQASALRGDVGAAALLVDVEVVTVECGAAAVLDVDTPADLVRAGGPRGR